MSNTTRRFIRSIALLLSLILTASSFATANATDYDQGCIDLPETDEYTLVEIDYDETYDGFYDDYYDNYGFTDSEGNFNFSFVDYTADESFAIANAYIKYCEHPDIVSEYGAMDLETFVSRYANSDSSSPEEFLNVEYSLSVENGDVATVSSGGSEENDWYYNTGMSLPEEAVYGNTNLLGSVRKGDIIYESSGTIVASLLGHIAIVEGVFWDDDSNQFYIRIIEAIEDGVRRGILDETRMEDKDGAVLVVSDATTTQRRQAVDFCIAQLGKDYCLDAPLSYTTHAKSWYCSELVWAAYRVAGYELLSNIPTFIKPEQIYKSVHTDKREISSSMPADCFIDNNVSWAVDSIDFLANNGIMSGISKDRFAPNLTLTRAMIVTILYRLVGCPSVTGSSTFTDVTNTELYYYDAVIWGEQNDIIQGYTATLFRPNAAVTREQLATFLYRFAGYKAYSTAYNGNPLEPFTDSSSVSTYALEPMAWAVDSGLIKGTSATILSPKKGSSRAQVAVVVYRFITEIMST